MGRYLVIENEPKLTGLIQDSIKAIDNSAEVIHFDNLILFDKKISELKEEEKPEFFKFNLHVINLSDQPPKNWKSLLEKIKKQTGLPGSPICVTTYEGKGTSLSFLKQLEVFNIIFKPFDPLILKETINLSLQAGKLATPVEIKSQKSSAFIAVLKEVELESISELGFLTVSDALVPVMSLTKYFSPLFVVGRKQSVWAQCLASLPHPSKPNYFINKFQFYYVKKDFLNQIRKYVNGQKPQETSSAIWNLEVVSKTPRMKIALVAAPSPDADAYKKDLQSHFTNLEIDFLDYSVIESWEKQYDHDWVINASDLQHDQIKSYFKGSAKYLWMPSAEVKEDLLKDLAALYVDIFTLPHDRSYFYKKLKNHIPELTPKEAPYLLNVTCHEIIKAANTIKVSEVSEVFINFLYSRELELNSFREFIFLSSTEDTAIEIPAFCQFKEKAQNTQPGDKNIFFHQFIFFAMSDHFQKEIRLWLLHNYISQNQKES